MFELGQLGSAGDDDHQCSGDDGRRGHVDELHRP
jgi:hypothetical protein